MIDFEAKMTEAYKKAIFGYLKERIKEDDYLAVAVQRPNKTIEGVIAYIKHEAKKQAKNGVACIPDEEVYGWAVHYIMEKELDYEPKGKKTDAGRDTESEDLSTDEDNERTELAEKGTAAGKTVSEKGKASNGDKKPEVKKEEPKTLEQQMQEFYAESELFRGL